MTPHEPRSERVPPAAASCEARCPVCAESTTGAETPVLECPRCATPHHRACWVYNTGCSIYGCSAQAPAPQRPLDLSAPYEEPKPGSAIPGLALRATTPFGYRPPRSRIPASTGIGLAIFVGILLGGFWGNPPKEGHKGLSCAIPILKAHDANEPLSILQEKLEKRCKCVRKRIEKLDEATEATFLTQDMKDSCACVRNWAAVRLAAWVEASRCHRDLPREMELGGLHESTVRLVEHRLPH